MTKAVLLFFFATLFPISIFSQISFNLDEELITEETLENICDNELSWLRNEIYARRGYIFSNNEYQTYFEQFDWYVPQQSNKDVKLSQIELNNALRLKKEEAKRNARTKAIMSFLEGLKTGQFFNSNTIIKILNKVNIYDLKFCGPKSVSVACGEEDPISQNDNESRMENIRYTVTIRGNKIVIGSSYNLITPIGSKGESMLSPRYIEFHFDIDNENIIDENPTIFA